MDQTTRTGPPRPHRRLPTPWLALLAVLSLVGAAACQADTAVDEAEEEVVAAPDADGGTALEEADEADTAEDLVGETVEVAGVVEEVISPRAFRISGDELREGTLVLSAEPTDVTEDDRVEVTGTVDEVVLGDIEEEYGFEWDDELFPETAEEYVVRADRVEIVLPE